jgi:hypothetical protein
VKGSITVSDGGQGGILLRGPTGSSMVVLPGALAIGGGERHANAVLTYEGLHLREGTMTRAALGCIELEAPQTGAVEQRPMSSIILFDKDGLTLWQAP